MNQLPEIVDHLKKVTVQLEISSQNFSNKDLRLEFIVGLHPGGWTDFEKHLAKKTIGDEISMVVSSEALPETLGHFHHMIPILENSPPELVIRAKILNISTPENREIVKAIAQMTSCGCNCCGGH